MKLVTNACAHHKKILQLIFTISALLLPGSARATDLSFDSAQFVYFQKGTTSYTNWNLQFFRTGLAAKNPGSGRYHFSFKSERQNAERHVSQRRNLLPMESNSIRQDPQFYNALFDPPPFPVARSIGPWMSTLVLHREKRSSQVYLRIDDYETKLRVNFINGSRWKDFKDGKDITMELDEISLKNMTTLLQKAERAELQRQVNVMYSRIPISIGVKTICKKITFSGNKKHGLTIEPNCNSEWVITGEPLISP